MQMLSKIRTFIGAVFLNLWIWQFRADFGKFANKRLKGMCYHVSQITDPKNLARKLSKQLKANYKDGQFKPRYHLNGFDQPLVAVVPIADPDHLRFFRWKLIPEHVIDPKAFKTNTLNARSEDLLQKSSYRNYWQNRCLVVVDGFFEPHVVDPKKPSQSYYIRNFENEPLTLGGIYAVYQGKGTFAILTTEANDQMKRVHNEGQRMPVILDERHRDAWLSPKLSLDEMMTLCKPYDQNLMDFRTIDGVFNSRANTDLPEAIMPRVEDSMI